MIPCIYAQAFKTSSRHLAEVLMKKLSVSGLNVRQQLNAFDLVKQHHASFQYTDCPKASLAIIIPEILAGYKHFSNFIKNL